MVVHTYIETNDFSGKALIPLCTHESSGICNTYQYIKDFIIEEHVIVTDFSILGTEARKPEAKNIIENLLKTWAFIECNDMKKK